MSRGETPKIYWSMVNVLVNVNEKLSFKGHF